MRLVAERGCRLTLNFAIDDERFIYEFELKM